MPTTTTGGSSNAHVEREPGYEAPAPEEHEDAPQEPAEAPEEQEAPEVPETPAEGSSGPETGGGQDEDEPYADLSFSELRAALRERGLPAGGTAEELRERLHADDASKTTEE